MCPFIFILQSQDMGDILSNLPVERKNCQIVFQQDFMQLTAVRAMRKQAWLPIIPYAFELCCVKLLCFLETNHP